MLKILLICGVLLLGGARCGEDSIVSGSDTENEPITTTRPPSTSVPTTTIVVTTALPAWRGHVLEQNGGLHSSTTTKRHQQFNEENHGDFKPTAPPINYTSDTTAPRNYAATTPYHSGNTTLPEEFSTIVTYLNQSTAGIEMITFGVKTAISSPTDGTLSHRLAFIKKEFDKKYKNYEWSVTAGKGFTSHFEAFDRNSMVLQVDDYSANDENGMSYLLSTMQIHIFQEICQNPRRSRLEGPPIDRAMFARLTKDYEILPATNPRLSLARRLEFIEMLQSALVNETSSKTSVCDSIHARLKAYYSGAWTVTSGYVYEAMVSYFSPNFIHVRKNATFSIIAYMQPQCS